MTGVSDPNLPKDTNFHWDGTGSPSPSVCEDLQPAVINISKTSTSLRFFMSLSFSQFPQYQWTQNPPVNYLINIVHHDLTMVEVFVYCDNTDYIAASTNNCSNMNCFENCRIELRNHPDTTCFRFSAVVSDVRTVFKINKKTGPSPA